MAPEPLPIFGERERRALTALIELWQENDGVPIDPWSLGKRLRWPWDSVFAPMGVCCRHRLAWQTRVNRAIVDGWIPLVGVDQIPSAQPYPTPITFLGLSEGEREQLKRERGLA